MVSKSIFPAVLRLIFQLCVGVSVLAGSTTVVAATDALDPRTLVAPQLPDWITPPLTMAEPSLTSPAVVAASSTPTRLCFLENQVNVASAEDFHHYAYRIETEAGLQQAGQVSLDFAPGYQTLRWHFLRIWRAGVVRDILDPESVQVLRQEENAERFLYHGRMTALVILHDVRVGDIVELAYTRTGENPVFAGRFSTSLSGANSTPVDRLYYRIWGAKGRPLMIAPTADFAPVHQVMSLGGRENHTWVASGIKAIRPLNDVPASEGQYPFAQITEYTSWNDVRNWARELFADGARPAPEVLARVKALTDACPTVEEKAAALLRFVQDDIRYLAVQLQENTHRPASPLAVIERRFGDCKDKSLLLVVLLRGIGLEADVALVSSTWQRGLVKLQPSPISFDHAIVRVRRPAWSKPEKSSSGLSLYSNAAIAAGQLKMSQARDDAPASSGMAFNSSFGGSDTTAVRQEPGSFDYLWLDPTSTLQGGAFDRRPVSEFGYALVLSDHENGLTRVSSQAAAESAVDVAETYTMPDYTSPARLEVVSTYRGAYADYYRYYRRVMEPDRYTQQLTAYLARFYPKIKAAGTIEWTDDREANVMVSRGHFDLPDFWQTDAQGRFRSIEIFPWAFSERLPRPETLERAYSFALLYPLKLSQRSELILPKSWPDAHSRVAVSDETFDFTYDAATVGNHVNVEYRWRSLADAVPPAALGKWSKKMTEVRATLGYKLQQNIRLAAAVRQQGVVWPLAISLAGGLLAGAALGWFLYRWKPSRILRPPPLIGPELTGIGGWLVLVAIGVVVRPLFLLVGVVKTFPLVGNMPNWISLTDPESVGFLSGFAPLLCCEVFMQGFLLAWSLTMIGQFFKRRASFPPSLIGLLLLCLVWPVVDHFASGQVSPSTSPAAQTRTLATLIGQGFFVALWIPYLCVSQRVKATFRASSSRRRRSRQPV